MVDKWLKEAPPAVQSVWGWLLPKNGEGITREELLNIAEALKEVNEAAGDNTMDITCPTGSCEANVQKTSQKAPPTCQEAQRQAQAEAERIKNSYTQDVKKRERGLGFFSQPLSPLGEAYLMPSQYREINKAITQAYADLVTDAPYLPWARVGHIVTAQFGCNMWRMTIGADSAEAYASPYGAGPHGFEPLIRGDRNANDLDDAIRAIGEGNIRIFEGLYPTMRLVADLGVDKFLECAKNGHFDESVPKELIKAIEELKQGNFAKAEAMIVDYEQREIAPPIYREFRPQYELMQHMGSQVETISFGIFNPQSVLPVTHCTLIPGKSWRGIDPVPMDGSLFNEDDRVDFYKKLAPYIYKYYGR